MRTERDYRPASLGEAIIREIDPDLIESSPKSGPTVLSSRMIKGAGRAPDLRSRAKSVADWKVKFPEICPLPPKIGSLICGALIILLSKIIANLCPTYFVVALPNFLAPTLSSVKLTVVSPVLLSTAGLALIKLSLIQIENKNYDEALLMLDQVKMKDSFKQIISEIKGDIYNFKGNKKESLKFYNDALDASAVDNENLMMKRNSVED